MSLLDSALASLRVARDWFADALDEYFTGPQPLPETVEEAIARARQMRGDDKRKKEYLASFFQTKEGSKYNSFQRKMAYDELLGERGNRRLTA